MPKPKGPPQFNAGETAQQQAGYNAAAANQSFDFNKLAAALSQGYYKDAFANTMAMNTMGQNTPYGKLTYTTSIDPITGAPKYTANTELSPEQQSLLDTLQKNQQGFGNTAQSLINNTFGQYTNAPDLVGGAASLTNQALDKMIPAWERFNAPMREQTRTNLINQGLKEGSPAYQQEYDKLIQQQQRNQGEWMANFEPQAFQQATTQYQLPLQNAIAMLAQSQPGSLKGNLINTPQGTQQGATVNGVSVNPVDYSSLAKTQYEGQLKGWEANNAWMNAMIGGGVGGLGAVLGMPVNPVGGGTFGTNLMKGLFGGGGIGPWDTTTTVFK